MDYEEKRDTIAHMASVNDRDITHDIVEAIYSYNELGIGDNEVSVEDAMRIYHLIKHVEELGFPESLRM
jgi:hypothetical protein